MPRLIILGSSNAISSASHENTHMIILGEKRVVMIDSVGNSVRLLERAGVEPNSITDLVLTHFHPDHVSGVSLLLMDLWLMGRTQPLNIYGLDVTLEKTKKMMDLFGWDEWPNFYLVNFFSIPSMELAAVFDDAEMRIISSPMQHFIPIIGLRVEFKTSGKVMAYSCDTEPCPQDIRLAEGADVLLHEAAGKAIGHTSAEEAGEVARKAEVGSLYLIHYPTGRYQETNLISEAQKQFPGPVQLAEDMLEIDFS
jgi:ribonuclease Z